MLKWIAIAVAALLGAVALVPLAVTWIESRQARQLDARQPYAPTATTPASRVAVVYFSRSGNTALAARHLARRLDAQLFPLEAPDYPLGVSGLAHALRDANALKSEPGALPDITPRTLDLTPFDSVWLGSPVWLYSPAPPIWAFVEHNRFDGQHVVLFNTFNSQFGDDHITKLRAKVMARGARSFEHRHVLRGRMTRQLTPDEMIQAIDDHWFGAPASP
ncbi:flavodoxin family protein [Pseudomonas paralcaligenes]|uniref:flavodoxin family protein n=1 Tax=Pseudomonas paralcaligenes TaxID=2772558 RepID=UPI001C7FDE3E|nr:flavodoxin [Pseudomonas paralcaligenes]